MQPSSPVIVIVMEGKDAQTAQQEKATRKRTRRIGPQERTRQRKAWTLREYGGKPLWDWMDLLIVPFMLALVTVAFTLYQDNRQNRIEERRADSALKTEEQRAQDAALQAYLDQMGTLLLKEDLRTSADDSEVRTLARARTATVIQRLDADGNRNVIRFLDEAGLTKVGQSSPGLLAGVDLQGAHLGGVDLDGTDLSILYADRLDDRNTNLSDADLNDANLSGANLSGANLNDANLSDANLSEANLSDANLNEANLSDANLNEAKLTWASLSRANLRGAEIVAKLHEANLHDADLSDANLSFANLSGADLRTADLSEADLRGADLHDAWLHGATLWGANLTGARGITKGQLDSAKSLEGVTMPDGSKHP
jgi:uncharacterized protein YjbI with pentapeptide repeats